MDSTVSRDSASASPAERLRLLIVEDNIFDAELVVYQLKRTGFEVESVRVENEADYRSALEEKWDVIIADYLLPLITAPRALEILRELNNDTPFIVVTGQAGEELAVNLIHLGASDYLMKDRLLRLGSAVRHAVDLRAVRRAKLIADRAVRDSERRHRMIAGEVTDYACSVRVLPDGQVRCEWVTASVSTYNGRPIGECIADGSIIEAVHPDDRHLIESQMARATQGISSIEEMRLRDFEGEWMWMRNYLLVDLEEANPEGVCVFIAGQDITAQKHETEMLGQHATELVMRNEELDAFAHTVAHDLRNPLNLIVGFAELLADMRDASFDEMLPHLTTIARTGRLMINIVDELMLLSGVRKSDPSMVLVDLGNTARDALHRIAHLADQAGAIIEIQPDLPCALGHPAWVEEALVNYMSNAIKYGGTPPRVIISGSIEPDGTIRLDVRDNGHGIEQHDIGRLFKPFNRLETVRAQGHGLGLSIVRRIIERMGGRVFVASTPGEGSQFSFTLPGLPQATDAAVARSVAVSQGKEG